MPKHNTKKKRNRFTAEYSAEHAIQRFKERYDAVLSGKELTALINTARDKVKVGE